MKNLIISITLLLVSGISQATILRVNNKPGLTDVYTTAQAAHNAASNGDTIHLEPSTYGTYGALNVTKSNIVLIGTGAFLAFTPNIQLSQSAGSINYLEINASTNFTCLGVFVNGDIVNLSSNTLLRSTFCNYLLLGQYSFSSTLNFTNIRIERCYINNGLEILYGTKEYIITNSFLGKFTISNGLSSDISGVIAYNIIGYSGNPNQEIRNAIVANNIFRNFNGGWPNLFLNSNVSNCISAGNYLPTGNGNVNNVDMNLVFNNLSAASGNDMYELSSTYPNQNIGMYAGPDPYKRACTPPIPSIYELILPALGSGNSINVTVSTKSNN